MTNRATPKLPTTRGHAALARLALGGVVALALTACDSILEVSDPDTVLPGDIQDPTALPAVRAHAIGEFAVAYSANPQLGNAGNILLTGLLADEFIHTGTFDTREIIDRRIVLATNPHVQESFLTLHRARTAAELATSSFAEHGANTTAHAEVQNLAGYTYIMFGEMFCSGVPYSRQLPSGQFEYGERTTTTQTFQLAVDRFDAALQTATAANSAAQQNLARLGRGRALLGMGLYQQAAQAVADVPTSYEYVLFHAETSARQNNGVWFFNNSQGRWSIADREGTNGLPFRSEGDVDGAVSDPRIPTEQVGLAQRGTLRPAEHWAQLKYPTRASPTILANGIEARLIEAEAALRQGVPGVIQFAGIHNALRATVGLPALDLAAVTAMTQTEREDLHFRERAYWLWMMGRRLGDLRRMIWDYGRQQDEIFPIGAHHRAGTPYGTDTNFPIPFDEQNNPALGANAACLQRDDHAGRQ